MGANAITRPAAKSRPAAIQFESTHVTGWTRLHATTQNPRMPLIELDDLELASAARGARTIVDQAKADADRQQNPSMRAVFERSVQYHQALVEKFEKARRQK
jgi:hypothetical protein